MVFRYHQVDFYLVNFVFMKKQKILVTGSAGFMGSHLFDFVKKNYADKYLIYGVDDLSGGYLRNVSDRKTFTKLNLIERKKTAQYIAKLKPEIIFHFAADAAEGRSQFTPLSALDRNLTAYMNVLVPAINNGLKKMVLISSMSVYGKQQAPFTETMKPEPEDVYGIMKMTMEEVTRVMAQVYGYNYLIFRPHNVYGPRQNVADPYRNVISIFINTLLKNKSYYIYGDGLQKRAYTYIDDITPIIAKTSLTKKFHNHIFNIGSDEVVTLNQLSDEILKSFYQAETEKIKQPLFLSDRPLEVKEAFCDHKKAKQLLGYKVKTDLKTGLKHTINWIKSIGAQKVKYLKTLELSHKHTPKTWHKKLY